MKKHVRFFVGLLVASLITGCETFDFLSPKKDQVVGDLTIPSTTKMIAEDEVINITNYNNRSLTISNESDLAKDIDVDDILMIGVSDYTPYGALKRVDGINKRGSVTEFTLSDATLPEAIKEGSISTSFLLEADDITAISALKGVSIMPAADFGEFEFGLDHVNLYHDDHVDVWMDGMIKVKPEITIDFDFEMFQVQRIVVETIITKTENFQLTSNLNFEGDDEIEIARFVCSPIIIYGVVIVPEVSFVVGYDGFINCEVTTGFSKARELTNTLSYERGRNEEWQYVPKDKLIFEEEKPLQLTANAGLTAYAGPKLDLMIYGVVGPTFSVQAYLNLTADTEASPWWELWAGVQGVIGVEAGIFGDGIGWSYPIDIYREKIAAAEGPFPHQAVITGTVKDFETGSPLQGVDVTAFTGEINNRVTLGTVTTDFSGIYSISIPDGADNNLEFSKPGYLSSYYVLGNVEAGENYEVNVSLSSAFNSGTIKGTVKDAVNDNPISGVQVQVLKNGDEVVSGMTDNYGEYEFEVPAYGDYTIRYIKDNYQEVTYSAVSVASNEIKYLQVVLSINEQYLGNGDFGGVISNAFTGNPEPDVFIQLRANINQTTGSVIASTYSDSYGSYYFSNIPAGQYTLELSKSGFITNYTSAICIGNQSTGNQNGTISPVIDADEVRIILTWGEFPTDLDSHLTGPTGGFDRFHVYYAYPVYGDINLDVDDITSYGPETITIPNVGNGLYRYSVHDYTNRGLDFSMGLANSEAKVVVFVGNSLLGTFDVPNQPGTLWTVFEIDDISIVPINTMTYESTPSEVTKSAGRATDGDLMIDLPEKD